MELLSLSKLAPEAVQELALVLEHFEYAISLTPEKRAVLLRHVNSARRKRAKLLITLQDYTGAIEELKIVKANTNPIPEEIKRELADTYNLRGISQYNAAKYFKAIEDFQSSSKLITPSEVVKQREASAYCRVALAILLCSRDGSPEGLLELQKAHDLTTKIPSVKNAIREITRQANNSKIKDAMGEVSADLSVGANNVSIMLAIPENKKPHIRDVLFASINLITKEAVGQAITQLSEVVNGGYPVAQVFYARAICYGMNGDNKRMLVDLKAARFLESLGGRTSVGVDHGQLFSRIQNRTRVKVADFRQKFCTLLDDHFRKRKEAKSDLLKDLNDELDSKSEIFQIPM